MTREAGTRELRLFTKGAKRKQPRGSDGRFVRVRYTPERLKILKTAREMRERLGLPPSPWLNPFGNDE